MSRRVNFHNKIYSLIIANQPCMPGNSSLILHGLVTSRISILLHFNKTSCQRVKHRLPSDGISKMYPDN